MGRPHWPNRPRRPRAGLEAGARRPVDRPRQRRPVSRHATALGTGPCRRRVWRESADCAPGDSRTRGTGPVDGGARPRHLRESTVGPLFWWSPRWSVTAVTAATLQVGGPNAGLEPGRLGYTTVAASLLSGGRLQQWCNPSRRAVTRRSLPGQPRNRRNRCNRRSGGMEGSLGNKNGYNS